MQNLVFLLGVFLTLASAQCSLDGTAWSVGNVTLVFGASVGEWIPTIYHNDDRGRVSVWFVTVRQATSSRYEVMDQGVYGKAQFTCKGMVGQYNFHFSADCETLTFSVIYDECADRSALDGAVLTKTSVVEDGQCSSYMGTTMETSLAPQLSGESLAIYPAPSNLVIVSIGSYAAIFQLWTQGSDDPANLNRVQDLLSVPEGYACEERFYGQYFLTRESGCGAILCGKADSCAARAGLWQGVTLNSYSGSKCATDIEILQWPNNACSDGNIWTKTPYECRDQFGGAQCMFCRGVAGGLDVKLCLERNGAVCNDIFRSLPSQGWCNLEMECPASTLSLSVFSLLVISLALLF